MINGFFTAKSALRGVLIAAVIGCGLGVAQAQAPATLSNPNPSPASIATAKELLALKGAPEMFGGLVDNVVKSPQNTFLPTNPNLSKPMSEVTNQLLTEYAPKKDELLTEVARAYAKHFTEAELKELLVFYQSPVGRKALVTEASAVEDGFKYAQDWSGQFSEQVLTRFRAEMKKRGSDL